jgi:hypothetical protein
MLVYKCQQVIAATPEEARDWEMGGKTGTTHSARLAVLSVSGSVAEIRAKAKSAEELKAKLARYPVGKPAEVVVTSVVPVFRSGDRKPSSYEFTA